MNSDIKLKALVDSCLITQTEPNRIVSVWRFAPKQTYYDIRFWSRSKCCQPSHGKECVDITRYRLVLKKWIIDGGTGPRHYYTLSTRTVERPATKKQSWRMRVRLLFVRLEDNFKTCFSFGCRLRLVTPRLFTWLAGKVIQLPGNGRCPYKQITHVEPQTL